LSDNWIPYVIIELFRLAQIKITKQQAKDLQEILKGNHEI